MVRWVRSVRVQRGDVRSERVVGRGRGVIVGRVVLEEPRGVEAGWDAQGRVARCVSTERSREKDCYTLDCRPDEGCHPDRHIRQNILSLDPEHVLLKKIKGRVSQICLDYFWFQEGYWADKVFKPSFFHNSLPILTDLLSPNGAIYTAFVADIFIPVSYTPPTLPTKYIV